MADRTFGFDELLDMLDPETAGPRLEKAFTKAQHRVGNVFVKMARLNITQKKIFTPNAPATLRAKFPKSTPLVDTGDLVGSITYDVKDPFRLALGINSPKIKGGRYLYEVLHNGATIRRGSSVWVIPGRPFLRVVWEDRRFLAIVGQFYFEALGEAITGEPVKAQR